MPLNNQAIGICYRKQKGRSSASTVVAQRSDSTRPSPMSSCSGSGSSGRGSRKQAADRCICTAEQLKKSMMFRCAFCCELAGVKRIKTETDSEWDPSSPGREDVLQSVKTPQSGDSNATLKSSSSGSVLATPSSASNTEKSDAGSSVLTTPKFAGQTEPANVIDYSPSRATGLELEDRKQGIFKRDKAGDDDDRY